MKNLGTLYWYELKKIWKRKLTWVAPLALAALMVYVALAGAGELREDRKTLWVGAERISGQVMDEEFFSAMREVLSEAGEIGDHMGDGYFYLLNADYYYPYYMTIGLGLDPKTATAEDFYTARRAAVERRWAEEGLTGEAIAYWEAQEEQIYQPFTFQSTYGGVKKILAVIYGISTAVPLAVAVCLCGVFSEERRTRVDQLIFSSERGQRATCLAKLLAGMTVALLASALVVGALSGAYLLLRGWGGFDVPLQIEYLERSLPLTLGQALLLLGLLLLYGLLCGGATLLASALTRNTVAALAAPIAFMIAQAWIRLPGVQAADYLPNQLFNTASTLCNVRLVSCFGIELNNLEFGFLLYGTLTVVLLALCWPGWHLCQER